MVPGPEAQPTRAHVLAYGPESVTELHEVTAEEIRELRASSSVLWVSLVGAANVEAFRRIGDVFGLHVLALEDIVSAHQRPKAEDYDDQLLVILRQPHDGFHLTLHQLALVLGDGFVLSVEERESDALEAIRNRIRQGRGRIRTRGADYLAHALIDSTLDAYLPLVEKYRDQIESLEDRIFLSPDEPAIVDLHAIRHDLYAIRRALTSMRDAVGALTRSTSGRISDAARLYLRDCLDHASQLLDSVDACRELSNSLAELYDSRLNHRMNEIMKVLTVISTVFIPLSFIAGVYGMNFDPEVSPLNMPELRWRYGYPFALLLMGVSALGLLAFFWRKGWLGSSSRERAQSRATGSSSCATRSA